MHDAISRDSSISLGATTDLGVIAGSSDPAAFQRQNHRTPLLALTRQTIFARCGKPVDPASRSTFALLPFILDGVRGFELLEDRIQRTALGPSETKALQRESYGVPMQRTGLKTDENRRAHGRAHPQRRPPRLLRIMFYIVHISKYITYLADQAKQFTRDPSYGRALILRMASQYDERSSAPGTRMHGTARSTIRQQIIDSTGDTQMATTNTDITYTEEKKFTQDQVQQLFLSVG